MVFSPPLPFLLARHVQLLDFSLFWPGNARYMLLVYIYNIKESEQVCNYMSKVGKPPARMAGFQLVTPHHAGQLGRR